MLSNNGFKYEIGWNKFHLKLFGLWPDNKFNWGLFHAASIFFVLTVPRFAALLILWGDYDIMIQSLSTHLPFSMVIVKLLALGLKKKELASILNDIEDNWKLNDLSIKEIKIMKLFANTNRTLSVIGTIFGWSASTIGFIVQKWYNLETRIIKNSDSRLSMNLLWVVYLPWNLNNYYTIMLLLQLYTSVVSSVIYSNSIITSLMIHMCGQIKCIHVKLQNLCDDNYSFDSTPHNFHDNLKKIVQRHEKLNRMAKEIDGIFKVTFACESIICVGTLCLQGLATFSVIEGGQLNIFQILFSIAVQVLVMGHLYINCYYCHNLHVTSSEIGLAMYKSQWTNIHYKDAKLLLMIGHTQFYPMTVSAGGFTNVNLQLFLYIIKTSLSFLSVLWAMKNHQI